MNDLKTIFGEALLSYLLAVDVTELEEGLLTTGQAEVISSLRQLVQAAEERDPGLVRRILGEALIEYNTEKNTTFANAARITSGGQIPQPAVTGEGALGELLILARDAYPALLMPHPKDVSFLDHPPFGVAFFRHPVHSAFCRAVLSDANLKLLFPGEKDTVDSTSMAALAGVQSVLVFSTGHGGGLQLILLADRLLRAAYYRVLLDGELALDSYLSSVQQVLDAVGNMAAGRESDVPVIFGLSNIGLPVGASIAMAWATLHSASQVDSELLPAAVTSITSALIVMRPMRILHCAAFRPESPDDSVAAFERCQPAILAWSRETDRLRELAQLAILLASPDDAFLAAQQVSRTILDPFYLTPMKQWRGGQMLAPTALTSLDEDDIRRSQEWGQRVSGHPRTLDIAMRRMISAITERIDLIDGFIDAVLTWENMFSGAPETTLRVCGAIAWLLEPDDHNKRAALFDELRDLYSKRSGLVHGSIETLADTATCRNRAVRVGLESLKRLYANPSLLHEKTSAVRGSKILMGAVSA